MEPGNLSSIDERLDLSGYHAPQPLNQSIGKQVSEAIEPGIVVIGLGPMRPSPDHWTSSCAAHDKLLRSSLAHATPLPLTSLATCCDHTPATSPFCALLSSMPRPTSRARIVARAPSQIAAPGVIRPESSRLLVWYRRLLVRFRKSTAVRPGRRSRPGVRLRW